MAPICETHEGCILLECKNEMRFHLKFEGGREVGQNMEGALIGEEEMSGEDTRLLIKCQQVPFVK